MSNNLELKRAGLKITVPRVKILALLENANPHHLSAESIYQQLKEQGDDVGIATVYRVLTQFEAAGLVRRHCFEGNFSVFELEEGEHHDHLICVRCGLVKEFLDASIEKAKDEIAKKAGFSVTDHNHIIYGVCAKCR